jgi:hypothetical protein
LGFLEKQQKVCRGLNVLHIEAKKKDFEMKEYGCIGENETM